MDCSLLGSSIHRIFGASIVEWVAISFSRGSSRPRDRIQVFCINRQILYYRATWEAPGSPYSNQKVLWKFHFNHIPCPSWRLAVVSHYFEDRQQSINTGLKAPCGMALAWLLHPITLVSICYKSSHCLLYLLHTFLPLLFLSPVKLLLPSALLTPALASHLSPSITSRKAWLPQVWLLAWRILPLCYSLITIDHLFPYLCLTHHNVIFKRAEAMSGFGHHCIPRTESDTP